MKNVISQSLWLDLVNINIYAKVYQNIPLSSRDRAIFTFSEFEPRQRLGQSQMTFDNLLGYILSKFYQNIPNDLRVIDIFHEQAGVIFTFSEFEPWQRLGQSKMTYDNLLGYILSNSKHMQKFIKIFQMVYELSTFFDIFHKQAGVKIFTNCPVTKSMFDYRVH